MGDEAVGHGKHWSKLYKTGFSDDIANICIMILEAKTRSGFLSYDHICVQLHCFCGCVQRG